MVLSLHQLINAKQHWASSTDCIDRVWLARESVWLTAHLCRLSADKRHNKIIQLKFSFQIVFQTVRILTIVYVRCAFSFHWSVSSSVHNVTRFWIDKRRAVFQSSQYKLKVENVIWNFVIDIVLFEVDACVRINLVTAVSNVDVYSNNLNNTRTV